MTDLSYTLGDRVVSEAQLRADAALNKPLVLSKKPALKRTQDRDKASHSAGFLVSGYTPTLWAQLPDLYAAAIKAHEKDETVKHPGTLDEFILRYTNKNKPKRVRSKPYELHDAAQICAELAEKAGWQRVRIDEVLKVES